MATGGQCGSSNRGQTAVFYWAGTYDAVGDLIGETGPDGLVGLASAYDGNGNRIETQLTDGAGVRSDTYTYDAFDEHGHQS